MKIPVQSVRTFTWGVIDACENGALSWEEVARECLAYMSEDDVEDMASTAWDMYTDEDDDEEEDEEV